MTIPLLTMLSLLLVIITTPPQILISKTLIV